MENTILLILRPDGKTERLTVDEYLEKYGWCNKIETKKPKTLFQKIQDWCYNHLNMDHSKTGFGNE